MLKQTVLAAIASLAFAGAVQAQNVTGAGATFPAPLYAKWAADYYKATGVKVNYQSIGSGAGIKQIEAKTVDFGASDKPLKDEELNAKGLIQFPVALGGVVPVINVVGVAPGKMRLTGAVLADIYLGKITKWNDPAIVALNPGLKLPAAAIAPVQRADGSGTSFIFTHYLSKVSPEWKSVVGEGTSVKWPVGTGGKGNEGVSAFVARLPNSIGYVEYAYTKQSKMTDVLVQNADGNAYLQADDASFKAAAAGADWSKSFYQILTNQPGKAAWPISGATFILVHAKQEKPAQGAAVLKFFNWALQEGDASAVALDYVPMPKVAKTAIEKTFAKVTDSAGKPIAYR